MADGWVAPRRREKECNRLKSCDTRSAFVRRYNWRVVSHQGINGNHILLSALPNCLSGRPVCPSFRCKRLALILLVEVKIGFDSKTVSVGLEGVSKFYAPSCISSWDLNYPLTPRETSLSPISRSHLHTPRPLPHSCTTCAAFYPSLSTKSPKRWRHSSAHNSGQKNTLQIRLHYSRS